MGVSIHPITLQIRAGSDHAEYGDPYDVAIDMQRIGTDSAYLSCARGVITLKTYREIMDALHEMGITSAKWERVSATGEVRTVEKINTSGGQNDPR